MKFSNKDFFGKGDQIYRKLRIWSHLVKRSFMENFIFVQWMLGNASISQMWHIFERFLRKLCLKVFCVQKNRVMKYLSHMHFWIFENYLIFSYFWEVTYFALYVIIRIMKYLSHIHFWIFENYLMFSYFWEVTYFALYVIINLL